MSKAVGSTRGGAPPPLALEVEGLTKSFGPVRALDGVSFALEPGEILGLVGPNGAGKTTLIHAVLGLLEPEDGRIVVCGVDARRDLPRALEKVGFSAAYVSLPYSLTVRENLAVFARIYAVRDWEERAACLFRRLGHPELLGARVRELSSGQQTLVHLVKALVARPRLLLLDEPTASLDPAAAETARNLVRELTAEEGFAVLITSHNMQEVEKVCGRVLFLHRGRILAEGSPAQVARALGSRDLEEAFIQAARGEAAMGWGVEPEGVGVRRLAPDRSLPLGAARVSEGPGSGGLLARIRASIRRMSGVVLRYAYLQRRSLTRVMEIFYWPLLDILVWGFLSVFLSRRAGAGPKIVAFLLGANILWDVLYRAQQSISLAFLEDVWSRNLLNIFSSPLRSWEYLGGAAGWGVLRVSAAAAVMSLLAWGLYGFGIFALGPGLVLFFSLLLLMGWAVGVVTAGLILRLGESAEVLAWALAFLLQPVSAVFYPVSVLPRPLQLVAWVTPSAHVFEGMREVLSTGRVDTGHLWAAAALDALYMVLALAFAVYMLATVKRKGLLSRFGE